MQKIHDLLKEECTGWKKWEVIWLLTACAVIFALSVYWRDTAAGIVSAVTGVACVVCTGKGKLSSYFFGLINAVLYAWISWNARYYGEVMLNALYYVPMQFWGFFVWSRHMNRETHEVEKRRMTGRGLLWLTLAVAGGTGLYGILLAMLGGSMPFVDALSTVVSVIAMAISVYMYMEQWLLWVIVDVVTVFMWAVHFAKGGESMATLLMWIVYLGNAVIMLLKWNREAKERTQENAI